MKFSILTPTYNSGAFLEKCIQSVLDQDHPDVEHIIYDGGSTDNSIEILRRYGDKIAFWASEKDAGQSDALRKCLAKATGDIVGWLNADEYYEPNIFGQVHKTIERKPNTALVYGNFNRVMADGTLIRTNRQHRLDYDVAKFQAATAANCAAFFRRDRLNACGGFDPQWHYLMDWDLYIRYLRDRPPWVRLDRVLGNFTMHKEAKTGKNQAGFMEELKRLRAREMPGVSWDESEKIVKKLKHRMLWHMFLDGVLFEKMWFKVVRQRHYVDYFGEKGVRVPVLSPLLDFIDPVKKAGREAK